MLAALIAVVVLSICVNNNLLPPIISDTILKQNTMHLFNQDFWELNWILKIFSILPYTMPLCRIYQQKPNGSNEWD